MKNNTKLAVSFLLLLVALYLIVIVTNSISKMLILLGIIIISFEIGKFQERKSKEIQPSQESYSPDASQ